MEQWEWSHESDGVMGQELDDEAIEGLQEKYKKVMVLVLANGL